MKKTTRRIIFVILYLLFGPLLFCILASSLHALTLSDIKTEIRRNLRDNPSDTSRRRYTDAVLLDYINESQREIVNVTWLAEKATSYILSPRTSYYALPDDMIAVNQVYFTNTGWSTIELNEVTQKPLYDTNATWETYSGTPADYWVSNSTSPSATGSYPLRISYMPIPTNLSTGTITIWYYNQVSNLSADTDVPFEGRRHLYPYHMAIAYHVTARMKIIEGKTDEATVYQSYYAAAVKIMQEKINQKPNYNPSFGR